MVESAQIQTLVSVKLNEKKHHIFICNNLWLKFSTHSIMKEDMKSWSFSSTCDFFTKRNYRYFHKALELLQKFQTVSYAGHCSKRNH